MITAVIDAGSAISALERVKESAADGIKETLDISLRDVQERARREHRWISRTGQAEREIKTRSEMAGAEFSGAVYTALPHGVFLHTGTKAHTIVPRKKQALRFVANGNFVFARRVRHPGIRADPYIYDAFDAETPAIISRFETLAARLAGTKE